MAGVFIQNIGEVKDAFDKIIEDAKKKFYEECSDAVEEVCSKIADTARELVPERSGDLKNAIDHSVKGTYGRVFTNPDPTYYGHMVHFGSVHNEADPFLYKASERHADELEALVKKIADGDLND